MNDKLLALADACLEVRNGSADRREALKLYRTYLQSAFDLGAGKPSETTVSRPTAVPPKAKDPAPVQTAPKTPAPTPTTSPTPAPAKDKPTGKVGADKEFK